MNGGGAGLRGLPAGRVNGVTRHVLRYLVAATGSIQHAYTNTRMEA